ncbi:hypothetical protein Xekk_02915 [Xenorhabdus sp. KK7.4]|nr:hypothetical protein Xekk_02915 [Xenorhabdus sp. KK7.4]
MLRIQPITGEYLCFSPSDLWAVPLMTLAFWGVPVL